MYKKLFDLLLCFLLVGTVSSSIAMHNLVFRAVQVATSGVVVGIGAKCTSNGFREMEKPINCPPASEVVTSFVNKGLEKHAPNHEKIPVVVVDMEGATWASAKDQVMAVDRKIAAAIESNDIKALQQGEAVKKHELKHILNQDARKKCYSFFAVPCAVQAISSVSTYGINRIFNRQAPRLIRSCAGRSLVAIGAIVSKGFLSTLGVFTYICHQEKEADIFACKNAESRQELEAFKDYFDESERDDQRAMLKVPGFADAGEKKQNILMKSVQLEALILMENGSGCVHPRSAHRSAMVQEYIDKWDAEHES